VILVVTPCGSKRSPAVALSLLVLAWTAPAFAGGGKVLPPTARPHGYSLTEMASLTGTFNANPPRDGVPPTAKTPFVMLYVRPDGDSVFTVRPGTPLYVPIVYSSDNGIDVTDQDEVADLYFSPDQFGAKTLDIVVDGEATSLIRVGYPVGAVIPQKGGEPLEYTTVAAFLNPLPPGKHTVTIQALFDGELLGGETFEFLSTFTVVVKQGPSAHAAGRQRPLPPRGAGRRPGR